MNQEVAIIGIGWEGFRPTSSDYSYKEMIYKAAVKAYHDAAIDPRKDVQSFISVSEDFIEGTSIFDEYTPDQLGAALKPMHTISGESLHGLITAYMLIRSGLFDVVAVEAHSKASNIQALEKITHYALDPIMNRPLGYHPDFIAGLEMQRFLYETQCTVENCSSIVQKNKLNALHNPLAAYGADLKLEEISNSPPLSYPLLESHISKPVDGAIVIVLSNKDIALSSSRNPVWIKGVGWCNDSYALEYRQWGTLPYVEKAAKMAYSQANIIDPSKIIDFAEIDDMYAYRELMTLTAVGLVPPSELSHCLQSGKTQMGGQLPVNPSGGSLGVGSLLDANGLAKIIEGVLQLRGEAGSRQINFARTALIQSWRGIPTTSTAVVILNN